LIVVGAHDTRILYKEEEELGKNLEGVEYPSA
jgi:hypothetical protein